MLTAFDAIQGIRRGAKAADQRLPKLRQIAHAWNLTPSYFLLSEEAGSPHDHIIVEHGLQSTSVISILDSASQTPSSLAVSDLGLDTIREILEISYNNLVDHQVLVSEREIVFTNNLSQQPIVKSIAYTQDSINALSSSQIRAESNAQLLAKYYRCDESFLERVRHWRRVLFSSMKQGATTDEVTAIINAIILVRAVEDKARRQKSIGHRHLFECASQATSQPSIDPWNVFELALSALGVDISAGSLLEFVAPKGQVTLHELDSGLFSDLVRDFYRPSSAPYNFDFDLLSKHALSRIYERYVTTLHYAEPSPQHSFLPSLAVERKKQKSGVVYTPLYIASFFAKFLSKEYGWNRDAPPTMLDPACGSGIFLRSSLEEFCNPWNRRVTSAYIANAFKYASGFDIDANAASACRLSLALLHLSLTGELPLSSSLSVCTKDFLKLDAETEAVPVSYDAIISNPPFIRIDDLSPAARGTIVERFASRVKGKLDTYIAFALSSLDQCRAGGFVCLVLPQTAMLAGNTEGLRQQIQKDFWIRCIVDLTEVPVFSEVGVYTVLLIVQRRAARLPEPVAIVARCVADEGAALAAVLDELQVETSTFSVAHVKQAYFTKSTWFVMSKKDMGIAEHLSSISKLSEFAVVSQGIVTGNDPVFIRKRSDVPPKELSAYRAFVEDRELQRFAAPNQVRNVVFYPYDSDGVEITETNLKKNYPDAWEHLNRLLSGKASSEKKWWRPHRLRDPILMSQPKIMTPHLTLSVKFSLDLKGQLVVSHSPFVTAKKSDPLPLDTLKLILACLNSSVCQWYINRHGFRFGRGYNRLEVKTLKDIPIPNFNEVETQDCVQMVSLVDRIMRLPVSHQREQDKLERELDRLVVQAYRMPNSFDPDYV